MDPNPIAKGGGRPPKQHIDALEGAAHVINVARALRSKRLRHLKQMGFPNESVALRFVMKRRRGAVGEYIGGTVTELLEGKQNKTQAALRLVIEHGVSAAQAARLLGIDRRNLLRLLPGARQAVQIETDRKIKFAASTQVQDFSYNESPRRHAP